MKWSFDKILAFIAVAHHLNFSAAARELYISPQALNKQIAGLEVELGGQLFTRTTRHMELTPLGRVMLDKMLPVKQQYDIARQQVQQHIDGGDRVLRFEFFPAIHKRFVLFPVVDALMNELADTKIELNAVEMDSVFENIREGRSDLAISNLHEFEQLDDLQALPLMEAPAQIFVAPTHPWANRSAVTRQELEAMPVILFERALAHDAKSFYRNINSPARHMVSSYNAMLATLQLGTHYAVFPGMVENMKSYGFTALPLPGELQFGFRMALIFRPNHRHADTYLKIWPDIKKLMDYTTFEW